MRQLTSGSGRHEDSKHLKMDEEPEFEMPDQTGHQQQGEASVLRLPRQGLRQALCSPLQGISAQAFPQAFPAPGLALHCEEVQSGSGTVTEASVQFKNQKRKVHDNGKTLMNKAASDIGYVSWLNCLDEDLSFSERVELWRVKSAFRCFINHFEAWEGLKRAMNMDSTGLTILSSTILGKKIKHAKDRVGHSIGQLLQPVWDLSSYDQTIRLLHGWNDYLGTVTPLWRHLNFLERQDAGDFLEALRLLVPSQPSPPEEERKVQWSPVNTYRVSKMWALGMKVEGKCERRNWRCFFRNDGLKGGCGRMVSTPTCPCGTWFCSTCHRINHPAGTKCSRRCRVAFACDGCSALKKMEAITLVEDNWRGSDFLSDGSGRFQRLYKDRLVCA